MSTEYNENRRRFLKTSGLFLGTAAVGSSLVKSSIAAPAIVTADSARPQLPQRIQIGDMLKDRAANYSPFAGLQFFGQVDIDAHSAEMTVRLKDIDGAVVYTKSLEPHREYEHEAG